MAKALEFEKPKRERERERVTNACRYLSTIALITASIFFYTPTTVLASKTDGTINASYRYAWSENAGWIDFGSSAGNVHVTDTSLTGSVYGENIGWIMLNPQTYGGVTNNAEGTLSGYAWSENYGWIDFSKVTIGSDGVFAGNAYGENIGWITFGTGNNKVSTDWRPSSARSHFGLNKGTISVNTIVINDNGGTKTVADFQLFVNGTLVVSGMTNTFPAPSNVYTVTESPDASYTRIFSGACDSDGRIALSPGDNKICTITNDDIGAPIVVVTPDTVSTPDTTSSVTPNLSQTSSSGLSSGQVASILAVLISFDIDNTTIANIQAVLLETGDTGASTSSVVGTFARDMEVGSVGNDVKALQVFLNTHGFYVASSGPGSSGSETTMFGSLTKMALAKYQKANGITPAEGYFGPKTRKFINNLTQ